MRCLLTELLVEPEKAARITPKEWDEVIPQARITALLATLYLRLEEKDLLDNIPAKPLTHLMSAWVVHNKQKESLEYEVRWLLGAFSEVDEQLIILKGAAYLLAGLPSSRGRLISDVDLLVKETSLDKVEKELNTFGWMSGDQDSYDDRYYRKWMHEIPPLGHSERESTLDVHHTILPPTANTKLDPSKLFSSLVEVREGVYVLSPVDIVIHSATHLFHEGEFKHGLRDLWDLDRLLRHYGENAPGFWDQLLPRALELNLAKSLFYALRYSTYFFETPVPDSVKKTAETLKPKKLSVQFMDLFFTRVFLPDHPSCHRKYYELAAFCLYIRSHYLRMPMYLLIPHLLRKAWMGFVGRPSDGEEELENQDEAQRV